ncbi:MAG: sigma 54-interacting transcriptional regulator [Candidatus Brocadiia bacterium]
MWRLVAIAGPDSGAVFDLQPGAHTVGRGPGAEVRLADESVSRRHAMLTVGEEETTVLDLDSHNGTRVNGQLVTSAPVGPGDRLGFGDTVLEVQRLDAHAAPTVSVHIVEQEDRAPAATPRRTHLPSDARRLAILYDVGNAINSALRPEELFQRILTTLFEVAPAERGALVLWDEEAGRWHTAAVHQRGSGAGGEDITLSRSIIDQALRCDEPLVSADAATDARFGPSESIEATAVRAMVCCSLRVRDQRLGVLYVDTPRAPDAFSDEDVQLVGAIANQAAIAIANARLHDALRQENLQLRRTLGSRHCIVGHSPAIRELVDLVRRVSQTDATVLVRGESGSGKEVVARTLHALSPRRARPFVCVNCAAMPEALLESELFGHEKGAFTGAVERRVGRFEQANGGTIFLDEIGEMPPSTQAKILRVLQEREFQRVGGTRPLRVDVRLVASTNRDLEAALETGAFRQDLYYRLKVIEVHLPPLRERLEDIPLLCEHFLAEIARDMGRQPPEVDEATIEALQAYPWPGNVRELRNVLERAMVLGVGPRLLPRHLAREVRRGLVSPEEMPEDLSLADCERRHVARVLQLTGWNKSRAAALLRISRPRLDRKIRDYDLQPPDSG